MEKITYNIIAVNHGNVCRADNAEAVFEFFGDF